MRNEDKGQFRRVMGGFIMQNGQQRYMMKSGGLYIIILMVKWFIVWLLNLKGDNNDGLCRDN